MKSYTNINKYNSVIHFNVGSVKIHGLPKYFKYLLLNRGLYLSFQVVSRTKIIFEKIPVETLYIT